MTYELRFLPEVEEDVIAGYLWYEAKSSGLGEDLWFDSLSLALGGKKHATFTF